MNGRPTRNSERGTRNSERATRPPKARSPRGFTLLELMVVIALIALLLAVAGLTLNTVISGSRTQAGINTVSAAAAATRTLATQGSRTGQAVGVHFLNPLDPTAGFIGAAERHGVAMLFTPADIRFIRHITANPDGTPVVNGSGTTPLSPDQPAYADIPDLAYIRFPKGSGVVGIARNQFGLVLLTPPFAIRFDRNGQLISRLTEPIYYDGDYDRIYEDNTRRQNPQYGGTPFEAAVFDPGDDIRYDPSIAFDPFVNKPVVPFEEIETVIGVIVFSEDEFAGAGPNGTGFEPNRLKALGNRGGVFGDELDGPDDSPMGWLLDQVQRGGARQILFNRYTGAIMKPQDRNPR